MSVLDTFDKIYEQYHADVYRFLLKLSEYNQILSEELTQEAFFQAYRSIHKFRCECHVRTWLFSIAKNVFHTYLRKENKTIPIEDVVWAGNGLFNPGDQFEKREMVEVAVRIIGSFQKNMADIMKLRIMGNVPYAQIALELGISESSAKVLFCRGKAALQKQLKEVYGYEI